MMLYESKCFLPHIIFSIIVVKKDEFKEMCNVLKWNYEHCAIGYSEQAESANRILERLSNALGHVAGLNYEVVSFLVSDEFARMQRKNFEDFRTWQMEQS